MPTSDTKAPQFVAAHPTWDGRGVTVGVVDTGVAYTGPLTDPDPTWVSVSSVVNGPSFTKAGAAWVRHQDALQPASGGLVASHAVR